MSMKEMKDKLGTAHQSSITSQALMEKLEAQLSSVDETNKAWKTETKQQAYKECMAEFERTKSILAVSESLHYVPAITY